VENGINVGTRRRRGLGIADVALNGFNTQLVKQRICTATIHTHPVTPRDKLFDDVRAEETSPAGDECEHEFRAEG